MHGAAVAERGYRARECAAVAVYAAVLALTSAHFVHESWSRAFLAQGAALPQHANPGGPVPLYAPQAYRILVPAVVAMLHRVVPRMSDAALLATIDGILLTVTLLLLYRAAVRGVGADVVSRPERGLRIALTLLFCTAALAWLTQFQRPETTPTALYLALALFWTQWSLWAAWPACLLLTVLQAFTRADVPFCLGLAILAAGCWPGEPPGRRRVLWTLGALTLAVAAGVQLYLQFFRFPHLAYDPETPVVQLRNNLHVHMWSNALLAAGPVWAAILWGQRGRWRQLAGSGFTVALGMGALYLPLWLTVGLGAEVRIYLPVVLMMSPLAAEALPRALGWFRAEGMDGGWACSK